MNNKPESQCSFCEKTEKQVVFILKHKQKGIGICNECITGAVVEMNKVSEYLNQQNIVMDKNLRAKSKIIKP